MKKLSVILCALALVFGVVGIANASLATIGTATYMGSDYNLIYEDDNINGGLVWLNYTNNEDTWQNQVDWASGLGGSLTVDLDPGYTTDIDFGSGWRLPLRNAGADLIENLDEMGHLFVESLGNVPYDSGPHDYGDFDKLEPLHYWGGTENWNNPTQAYGFDFDHGGGFLGLYKTTEWSALVVHPGIVSAVPIPSAIWLFISGLIGVVGFRKKFRKEEE